MLELEYIEVKEFFVLEPDADCKLRCLESCAQWFYSATIHASKSRNIGNYYLDIEINFPLSHSVMVSEETAAYTWTTLVSNVGGLIGIWLGASLLSFLQPIYLLLCPNDTEVEQFSGSRMVKLMERVSNIEKLQQNQVDEIKLLDYKLQTIIEKLKMCEK